MTDNQSPIRDRSDDARVEPSSTADELVRAMLARTPARLLVGRAGPAYRTKTQLELRRDHAAASDAVHREFHIDRDFSAAFISDWRLFDVQTDAADKREYLMRPDLGRRLSAAAKQTVARECPRGADLQIVIGDGLSATAVAAQVPPLLPLLVSTAKARGWTVGRPFVVRYCRVGTMNDIGELFMPEVVLLLIGERPGLSTAESLSAYLAYRPRTGHTDAQRNLVSNIHRHGLSHDDAATRIMALAEAMRTQGASGIAIKYDEAESRLLPP